MSNIKFDMYKKVTDEFRLLYNAFRESGFTKDEAFELVKCYCTSANLQSMVEKIIQDDTLSKHRNRSDMIRYMGKFKKGEEDDKDKTVNG